MRDSLQDCSANHLPHGFLAPTPGTSTDFRVGTSPDCQHDQAASVTIGTNRLDKLPVHDVQQIPNRATFSDPAAATQSGTTDYLTSEDSQAPATYHNPASGAPRFVCLFPGCNTTCGRESDLNRHMQRQHQPPKLDCNVPGCHRKADKGFRRKDKLREHRRDTHGLLA